MPGHNQSSEQSTLGLYSSFGPSHLRAYPDRIEQPSRGGKVRYPLPSRVTDGIATETVEPLSSLRKKPLERHHLEKSNCHEKN
jgi:hypothetical protein